MMATSLRQMKTIWQVLKRSNKKTMIWGLCHNIKIVPYYHQLRWLRVIVERHNSLISSIGFVDHLQMKKHMNKISGLKSRHINKTSIWLPSLKEKNQIYLKMSKGICCREVNWVSIRIARRSWMSLLIISWTIPEVVAPPTICNLSRLVILIKC
jgi:hypothetical protein